MSDITARRKVKSGHHLTLNCAPDTAQGLRMRVRQRQASLSAAVATGFARYLDGQITTDIPAPAGALVSIGVYIDVDLARRTRARLAEHSRTMPWLLHQIASMHAPLPALGVASPAQPADSLGLHVDQLHTAPNIDKAAFARRLLELMAGGTQRALAQRIGVPPQYVNRYLKGILPDPDVLMKIALTYHVTIEWLLGGYEPREWRPSDTQGLPFGLLPDRAIRRLALEHRMIEPFVAELVRPVGPSYGLGSAGYDIRLAPELLVASGNGVELDPHASSDGAFARVTGDRLVIPPHGFALGRSVETFTMPRDVIGLAVGKSTFARLGIHILVTPLEPGWCGTLTIELANLTSHPAVVYANEGITQVLFMRIPAPEVSYAERNGLYQGQRGITLARTALSR